GDDGDSLFLIVRGDVRIVRDAVGSARTVAVLSRGDCVGEIALLLGVPRTASAIAATDVEALVVGRGALDALFAQSHTFVTRARSIAGERVELLQRKEERPAHLIWVSNLSDYPTEGLALLLAQALRANLGEDASLLVVGDAGPAPPDTTIGGVRH